MRAKDIILESPQDQDLGEYEVEFVYGKASNKDGSERYAVKWEGYSIK